MTSLPSDWGGLTTHQGAENQSLIFTTTRRGIQEQSPNALNLSKNLASLDGQKFRVSDDLSDNPIWKKFSRHRTDHQMGVYTDDDNY